MRFGNLRNAVDDALGYQAGRDVVELANVGDGILSGERFVRHWTEWRDQTVDTIATSRLAVIARLGRGAGDGEIEAVEALARSIATASDFRDPEIVVNR